MSLPIDGTLDLQGVNKIINAPTPTQPGDVVPKSYADAIAQGVIYKQAVQAAAAVADGNIAINAAPATLDGVNLANGMRVLLLNQTAPAQNGIWVFNGAGAPMTRPADFAPNSQMEPGTAVFVEHGTTNADRLFGLIASANVTVDTTAESWSPLAGTGGVSVNAPLTMAGNTISLNGGNPLPLANGGTGAATAAGARTSLGAPGKFAASIGDGATTTFSVAHNLGTTDVTCQVFDMATGNLEIVQTTVIDANHVQVGAFGVAPAAAGGAMGSGTGKRVIVTG